jgi:uracil-DNA glycosylase
MKVNIEQGWKKILQNEFEKEYFFGITNHIKTELDARKTIYPKGSLIFNAFNSTGFYDVKVVILGQDPYHGAKMAMGLSFSVEDGCKIPKSLQNIYKELRQDIGLPIATTGNLINWTKQGVLLLNTVLTVREGEPGSHAKIGWMQFTDTVIREISNQKQLVVFLLWGKFAQEKELLIDTTKHFVLKAAHPSPFSVEKGFFGCKHFSKTNEILAKNGIEPIDWKV